MSRWGRLFFFLLACVGVVWTIQHKSGWGPIPIIFILMVPFEVMDDEPGQALVSICLAAFLVFDDYHNGYYADGILHGLFY
jgi:hypothetical protein